MIKLVGMYDSPFVRRVAISLYVQGFTFQHVPLSVFRNIDAYGLYNPLLKAPTLVLADGAIVADSSVILDYLDERTPERRLIPASGSERLQALQVITTALVAAEKTVDFIYETRLRPPEKQLSSMIERHRGQVDAALGLLEAQRPSDALPARLMQVEITTAVAYRCVAGALPELVQQGRYPRLAALSARCEELPAFLAAPLER